MPTDPSHYRLAAYIAGSDDPVDTAEVQRFQDKDAVWIEMRQRHPGACLVLEPTRPGGTRWMHDPQEGWHKAEPKTQAKESLWSPANN